MEIELEFRTLSSLFSLPTFSVLFEATTNYTPFLTKTFQSSKYVLTQNFAVYNYLIRIIQ